jgi:hypothetical protein
LFGEFAGWGVLWCCQGPLVAAVKHGSTEPSGQSAGQVFDLVEQDGQFELGRLIVGQVIRLGQSIRYETDRAGRDAGVKGRAGFQRRLRWPPPATAIREDEMNAMVPQAPWLRPVQMASLTVLLATLSMPAAWAQSAPAAVPSQGGYVHLNAAMYPSPKPNVPAWTGVTMVTSPALAPHEMLYPHTYRALYPPYYHRVVGGYVWTPFGIRSHEKWELQGTMVQVKYRSSMPLFHHLPAPTTSYRGGAWR